MTSSACPTRTHVHPLGVRIATGKPLVAEVAMDQSIAIVMTAVNPHRVAVGRRNRRITGVGGGTGSTTGNSTGNSPGGTTEIMDRIIAKGMGS